MQQCKKNVCLFCWGLSESRQPLFVCLRSEGDAYAQAYVVHPFRVVRQEVAAVGAVVIIGSQVQPRPVGPGEDVQAYFGRDVETPCLVLCFEDVEGRGKTGVLGSCLYRDVGLEGAATVPRIAARHAKGQAEIAVLLVGAEAFRRAEGQHGAGDVFMVGVPCQEHAEAPVVVQVVAAFDVHAPSAGVVGEAVSDGEVVLPVHAGIAVIAHLCPCRQGGCQHKEHGCTDACP